jgi:hypothetical protein
MTTDVLASARRVLVSEHVPGKCMMLTELTEPSQRWSGELSGVITV